MLCLPQFGFGFHILVLIDNSVPAGLVPKQKHHDTETWQSHAAQFMATGKYSRGKHQRGRNYGPDIDPWSQFMSHLDTLMHVFY